MSPPDAFKYVEMFGDGVFSDEQAVQIVDFVERIKDKVNGFLIHCEAGVSRSAAVAAAIDLIVNGSSDRILLLSHNAMEHRCASFETRPF